MAKSDDDLDAIGKTLVSLAKPGMKPKELLEAVRDRHPKASRKLVARAAFYSIILHAGEDDDKAQTLQNLAIAERTSPE